jgi:gliding motility-associated protein GldC
MSKRSDIEINVTLGEDQIPENIAWRSTQNQDDKWTDSKAMLLSFFDTTTKDTLKIDLWTKEMQIMEMDRFFYYTLKSMGDTYLRATNNVQLAEQMQAFINHFGTSTGIVKPQE